MLAGSLEQTSKTYIMTSDTSISVSTIPRRFWGGLHGETDLSRLQRDDPARSSCLRSHAALLLGRNRECREPVPSLRQAGQGRSGASPRASGLSSAPKSRRRRVHERGDREQQPRVAWTGGSWPQFGT